MQVFSRENLKITAMTENTVRASAFWQKNRVRFCENGVCQTARICDKIQKTANKFIKRLEDDINNRNIRIAV